MRRKDIRNENDEKEMSAKGLEILLYSLGTRADFLYAIDPFPLKAVFLHKVCTNPTKKPCIHESKQPCAEKICEM